MYDVQEKFPKKKLSFSSSELRHRVTSCGGARSHLGMAWRRQNASFS
jgi:hypothetical protein